VVGLCDQAAVLIAPNLQLALVTGASSGVGQAIALALAALGATVCLVGRKAAGLQAVGDAVSRGGGRPVICPADLGVDGDVRRLVSEVTGRFDGLDVLVHSAGVIAYGPVESAPVDALDAQYAVNVRAPFALTQALLPLLRARQGQVVFVNSTAGQVARAGVSQYAATKHALRALSDALRDEVNPQGIRVLSVFLGRTATPMQAAIHEVEGRQYRPEHLLQPADVAVAVTAALQLPRTAEMTDLRLRPMLPG
jgi:NAD(P)-dependent dehydrogenase (short-subunit alcohol dehydrogenase family)